ncbi:glycosyltransferase [Sulfurospirillum oryzae]|uniref:glycosyltransferase n=1 Tax=Sulfurospirillum oryzae TaxID=2976535 RepID=UPI0021E743AC|nr:glycosyltransferase [Sulfurospirillum oryzae]
MKILFITFFFPPYKTVASLRTGKTAKILFKMGYDIKIVSAKNNDIKEELAIQVPRDALYQTDWFDMDNFVLQLLGKGNKSVLRDTLHKGDKQTIKSFLLKLFFRIYTFFAYTPDKYIGWYKPAIQESESICKTWKPDIIYASGMPFTSLMVAASLSKKYSIPFVAELRDLWADNHYSKQYFFGKWLEGRTLQKASAIISVSQPLVERLYTKYKIPCYEIRNAFDEEDFIIEKEQCTQNHKIVILYTGMLYAGKQDPTILFQAIASDQYLKDNVECKFYGNALDWVNDVALRYGLANVVEVHSPIERSEVLKLQKNSDILLLLTWNDPKEKGVFTGKLFEYIGSAKPILAIGAMDDVATSVIKDNGFGLASNDISQIVNFIKNIKNDQCVEKINNAYQNNRMAFERNLQVSKLSQVFESILSK